MEIKRIPLKQLNPAKYNPRKDLKPGDPEYEKLKKSMETFGYVEPIVWNKRTRNVVSGHQRLKILQHQGHTEVECVVVDLDETQEIAFDRWGAVQMVQNLEGAAFTVVPFGQGFKDMSPPTKELMKLALEGKLAHGGHPVLAWNMDNDKLVSGTRAFLARRVALR